VAILVAQSEGSIDLDAIDAAARAELAGFKRPRKIEIIDALPRNTMGKVQKNELRARYAMTFQPKAG
jgi:malonyl-CoA/methylmalonyl-CoA synthetase